MKWFKWSDVLFTAILIAAALLLWVVFQTSSAGGQAVIKLDGKQIAVLPLQSDSIYIVQGEYTNVIEIKDGLVFVRETDCPNKICQKQGSIQKNGQSIVCVPNKMTVVIIGGEEATVDAITE